MSAAPSHAKPETVAVKMLAVLWQSYDKPKQPTETLNPWNLWQKLCDMCCLSLPKVRPRLCVKGTHAGATKWLGAHALSGKSIWTGPEAPGLAKWSMLTGLHTCKTWTGPEAPGLAKWSVLTGLHTHKIWTGPEAPGLAQWSMLTGLHTHKNLDKARHSRLWVLSD